jgi:hypothetical protein
MTATATHDTKRGEDARMRILTLSELSEEWSARVGQWMQGHENLTVDGMFCAPSRAHRYMIYQALVGAWPLAGIDDEFVARVTTYAIKAARSTGCPALLEAFDKNGMLVGQAALDRVPGRTRPEDPIPMFQLSVKAPEIALIRFSGPRSGEFLAADELRFTPLSGSAE